MLGAILVALLVLLPGSASAKSSLVAKGSVEQVHVFDAKPGKTVKLLRKGKLVDKDKAGDLGAVVFRKVKPGKGYLVKQGKAKAGPVSVMSTRPKPRSTKIYNQQIPADGYGYLKTRDGTKLALDVHPPQDLANLLGIDIPTPPSGKLPTLIEYAGYGYADPAGPQSGIQLIGNLMGFTVVDVNMRGTGCSGGAFDFFEPLQGLDAYDVIETVARQPWVDGHKVGMMGISYGGISQLFTAQYRPPSLAAISPLSVIDNTQTTLYPGGLLNTGFAYNWAEERVHDALPAGPDAGQAWAWKRIQEGDQTCKDNQAAHTEAVDLLAKVKRNKFYRPAAADPLDPTKFVHKINVPTFMACQWTDEQTGGHCPTLAAQFTGTGRKWFTYTNGVHTDSLDPETLNRWYDFLKIYVAKQAPIIGSATMQAAAPLLYQEAIGVSGLTLPPDPIQQEPTLAAAKQAFEGQPEVRVLFDNGAGSSPYKPVPGYIKGFDQFPPKTNVQKSWYLSKGGKMVAGQGRRQAQQGRRPVQVGRQGASRHRLHRRHRRRQAVERPPRLRLEPAGQGQVGQLRDQAAEQGHDRARLRRGAALGPLAGEERRPAGDRQRGPPRRQGNLRPGRLAANPVAQARQAREQPRQPGADLRQERPAEAEEEQVGEAARAALLRGPRLPQGLPDQGHDPGAERRSADLGIREVGDPSEGQAVGRNRPRPQASVPTRAAGHSRRRRTDRLPGLPRPARRAVPRLPRAAEQALQALRRCPAAQAELELEQLDDAVGRRLRRPTAAAPRP